MLLGRHLLGCIFGVRQHLHHEFRIVSHKVDALTPFLIFYLALRVACKMFAFTLYVVAYLLVADYFA
jgi:hypothetical protein